MGGVRVAGLGIAGSSAAFIGYIGRMTNASVVHQIGGPEVLRYEEHEPGLPQAGQARVRVTACGVNFIDVYYRTGLYARPLPFVEGSEGAGVVEAIGAGVGHIAVGDRVAWAHVSGSYAGAVVGLADKMVRIPPGVSDELAAAVILQGMTAHYLVHATRTTSPGDTALVHAAAGGVGLLLVQMLRAAGATVIGTCSTEDKARLVKEAGAQHVVLYTKENFTDEARRLTNGRGVDVVYDSVGQATFEGSLRALRPRGLLALFGQSSGPVPPLDLRRLNELGSLFVTRPTLAHYTLDRAELEMRATAVLARRTSFKSAAGVGTLAGRPAAVVLLSPVIDVWKGEIREGTQFVIMVGSRKEYAGAFHPLSFLILHSTFCVRRSTCRTCSRTCRPGSTLQCAPPASLTSPASNAKLIHLRWAPRLKAWPTGWRPRRT